jgi:hypothetical protein
LARGGSLGSASRSVGSVGSPGYSYVALEPSTVQIKCVDAAGAAETTCSGTVKNRVLEALPDNSVRISTRLLSGSASASVGAIGASVGVAGKSYEVIIDFANTQTLNVRFEGRWQVDVADTVKIQNRCYPFQRKIMGLSPFNEHELWSLEAKFVEIPSGGYEVATSAMDSRVPPFAPSSSSRQPIPRRPAPSCAASVSADSCASITGRRPEHVDRVFDHYEASHTAAVQEKSSPPLPVPSTGLKAS